MNDSITIRLKFNHNPEFSPRRVAELKINELVNLATSAFENINLLSRVFENDDIGKLPFLNTVNALSQIGAALVEAVQTVCIEENVFTEAKQDEK